jgi:hypothetical protein
MRYLPHPSGLWRRPEPACTIPAKKIWRITSAGRTCSVARLARSWTRRWRGTTPPGPRGARSGIAPWCPHFHGFSFTLCGRPGSRWALSQGIWPASGGLRAPRWAAQGRVATRAVGRGAARPLGPWAIAAHSPNPTQHRGPAGGRPPSRSLVNPPEVLAPGVWGGSAVGGHRDPGSVGAGQGSDPRPAAGPFVSVNPNPNPCLSRSPARAVARARLN